MTQIIKPLTMAGNALCGWAGAPLVWSLTASLGDLYCDPRLPRVRGKNLPPTQGEEVRPARGPQVGPPEYFSPVVTSSRLCSWTPEKGKQVAPLYLPGQFPIADLGSGVPYQSSTGVSDLDG